MRVRSVQELKAQLKEKQEGKADFNAVEVGVYLALHSLGDLGSEVTKFGTTEDDLVGVLRYIEEEGLVLKIDPNSGAENDSDDGSAAVHVKMLREALPMKDSDYIRSIAKVAFELGIPSDRMCAVAERITSPQQESIVSIEMRRLAELLMHEEDCRTWKDLTLERFVVTPDGCEAALAELTGLENLSLGGIRKVDVMLAPLLTNEACSLRSLRLCGNALTVEEMERLGGYLARETCRIGSLALWNNHIEEAGWEQAARSGLCTKLSNLTLIDVGFNGEAFHKGLAGSTCSLQQILLVNNSQHQDEGLEWLEFTPNLVNLELHSQISDKGVKKLNEVICKPKFSLHKLFVDGSGRVEMLSRGLQDPNCKLVNLELGGVLDLHEMQALGSAISSPHCHLQSLSFHATVVSPSFLESLASPHCKLDYLNLTASQLDSELLGRSLTQCSSLKDLSLYSEGFSMPWKWLGQSDLTFLSVYIMSNEDVAGVCEVLRSRQCKLQEVCLIGDPTEMYDDTDDEDAERHDQDDGKGAEVGWREINADVEGGFLNQDRGWREIYAAVEEGYQKNHERRIKIDCIP